MIGAFVRFRYEDGIDPAAVAAIAEGARERFVGMPGLRYKFFTIDEARNEAVNFYVWDSEEAAQAFFTEEMTERVTGLYGVRPTIEYVELAALVDNSG
jgi:Putative mono-oxygenase ydhR